VKVEERAGDSPALEQAPPGVIRFGALAVVAVVWVLAAALFPSRPLPARTVGAAGAG
jgi:hypothetical protein